MEKLNKKVEWWLRKTPSLRDDDYRLCSNIWYEELIALGLNEKDFLRVYSKGKLSSAPSIKRARAKLQKDKPQYRGEKYNKRQGIFQEKMRLDLGYNY